MNVCLVSWDDEAKILYGLLKDTYNIVYVIERDHTQWGRDTSGVQIISFSKAYYLFRDKKIDAFLIPCMRGINVKIGIYDRLRRNDIPAENILYAPLRIFKDGSLSKQDKINLICRFEERRDLDYVALHITDHCNLNCAYCSVFCGLIPQPSFVDFSKTKKALLQLKSYFDQVQVFRVLGGEPTLNPQWQDYCIMIKELFPFSDVEVVTNGTTILSMSDAQFKLMRDNHIAFDISHYPVLNEKIDEINDLLSANQITHYITQENEFFSKLYCFDGSRDMDENYAVCKMKFMCLNMRENYLGVCHAVFGLERAKQYMGVPALDDFDLYKVDLMDTGLSATKIIERLDRPMQLCRFCNQELAAWHMLSNDTQRKNVRNWSL